MKDNVGQRAPAHRSPRQDPCFDPLIRSPVSRDSRAAASGSFLDWKGLTVVGAVGFSLGTLGLIFSLTALRKINELEARLAKEAPRED